MYDEIKEIKELVGRLNTYRNSYYNNNTSLISDREYDALYDRLAALESKTNFIMSSSPTQNVGFQSVSQLKKVKHNHPLLSLDKTTDIKKFADYFHDKYCILMAKLDGLTCSLFYSNGKLVRAESRGNGEIGEDITHNALAFANLPTTIPFKGDVVVDGECIITYENFDAINKAEDTEYKNPRNLVSGSVRQLNSEVVKRRNVSFIAWKLHKVTNPDGSEFEIESNFQRFRWLKDECGFEVVPHVLMEVDNEVEYFEEAICSLKNICQSMSIPIDGIVGMFDDVKYGESLGRTGHHPRHSLAFKFYQEENETTLLDIKWSTSRTGLVNPVAVFEPVEIDGTTVSKATLNNVSIIKELELGIGDTVTVIKANQIIPQITQNLTRSNTYVIPSECPSCHGKLEIHNENGRETLYCSNPECPAIIHDKISNFATREGMNIVGISEERLLYRMNHGYITDFKSIYNLYHYRGEIAKLRGWGEASIDALLAAIENSKKCNLQNVIVAIGIPGIGKSAAKTIARYCTEQSNGNLLETLIELVKSDTDWSILDEIGKNTSDNINAYVAKHIHEIEPLVDILDISSTSDDSSGGVLSGKSFCITGKLHRFDNRNSLVYDIERNGGVVVSSVTAKTNYLITNDTDSGSSKNIAAQKYGTTIISEEEYIELKK